MCKIELELMEQNVKLPSFLSLIRTKSVQYTWVVLRQQFVGLKVKGEGSRVGAPCDCHMTYNKAKGQS